MRASALLNARAVRALDVLLAVWTVAWLAAALVTARELRELGDLADSAVAAANALEETATALGSLRGLPVVGDDVADVELRVGRAAARARADAQGAREDIRTLSLLLGAAIALVPTALPLALYLPLRRAWRRERDAIRRALDRQDPRLDEILARQAAARLPYGAGDPPSTRRLADSELERLGLGRPRARP